MLISTSVLKKKKAFKKKQGKFWTQNKSHNEKTLRGYKRKFAFLLKNV